MRKGSRMSISIPDKKMDDYARDCVVRLANRVDNKVLRERLLQMAREWKSAAVDTSRRCKIRGRIMSNWAIDVVLFFCVLTFAMCSVLAKAKRWPVMMKCPCEEA